MNKMMAGLILLLAGNSAWAREDLREQAFKLVFATQDHVKNYLPGNPAAEKSLTDMVTGLSRSTRVNEARYKSLMEECRSLLKECAERHVEQRMARYLKTALPLGGTFLVLDRKLQPGSQVELVYGTIKSADHRVLSGQALMTWVVARGWGEWKGNSRTAMWVEVNAAGIEGMSEIHERIAAAGIARIEQGQKLEEYVQALFLEHVRLVAESWKQSR